MKKQLLFVVSIVLTATFYAQNIPSYVPTNGLVGWWPFNGNANDESGNGNHGTVYGATLIKDRKGVANSAYSFNNNYIEIKPISKYNGMQDFTISTWVKLYANSSADVNYLICRGQDAGGNLYLGHKNATYIFPGGGGAVSKQHTYINVWNQITISRKDSVVSVFVNGELDSTFKNAQLYSTNNENIYFGVHKWLTQLTGYYPYYLQGELDDIAIYNRALTQLEINSFYEEKIVTLPNYISKNGLVGYWPFNGNANDESGNGNHGTVNGATLTKDRNGISNSAYSFNNNYIEIKPISMYNGMQDFTISTWVKLYANSSADVNYLICRGQDAGGNLYLGHKNATYILPGGGGAVSKQHTYVNVWNQITISRKDSVVSVFVNGELNSTYKNTQLYSINNENIYFGAHKWLTQLTGYYPYYLQGELDDIAIYNRALTQQEITALYTGTPITQNLPNYLPTNGLVGWWPFNGNANDESGNGKNGVVYGATLNNDRNGVSNSAFNFDGENDYIDVNIGSKLANGISMSVWIYTSMPTYDFGHKGILWNRITGPSGNAQFPANQVTGIMIYPNGLLSMASDGVNSVQIENTGQFYNNSAWHHVTFTFDAPNSISKIYVDGVLKVSNNSMQINAINLDYNTLKIGKDEIVGYGNRHWNGKIDDIAIYNRALTQEEITALYLGDCTKPQAAITPKSTTNIKENESVVLAATRGNGYTYAWYKDDVAIANATDSNYTATLPGVYTVKVTSAACDSTSAGVTVKRVYSLPNYLPSNGLVGWWPFNSNANDESGNENHGTVNGATLTSNREGEVNKAYNFDGINDFIKVLNMKFTGNTQYTISLWLNLNSGKQRGYPQHYILDNGTTVGGVFINTDVDQSQFGCKDIWSANEIGKWHHYLAIVDGNNYKLRINGIEVGNSSGCTLEFKNNYPLILGCSNVYTEFTNGKIDDIAIWNRMLSEQEITALYLGEACTTPTAVITPKSTTNIKENESVVLAATKGNGYTYAWYKDGIAIANATDSNYTATLPGVYTVKVTSTACDSTSVGVTVKRVYALPNYLPTNGLVGWWPFNGNANDESGNGNHGTVNGAMLTSDRNGKINCAYSFDGNNFIQSPQINFPLGNDSRSISCWINPKKFDENFRMILSYGKYSPSNLFSLGIYKNSDELYFSSHSNALFMKKLNLNQHYNIILTFNGISSSLFINGILFGSSMVSINTTSGLFFIGKDPAGGNFIGDIDDIAIYNRALTQEEITALYLGEACTTPIATITPQTATSFCSGGSVNLNAATNANYTYQWLNNGTPISAATTASYKATTSGKYSVIVKNNSGCIDTSSVVTVNVSATPSLPILTGPATLCYNSKAIFKASIAGGTWGVANDYLLISSPQGLFRNNKMPPSNLYKTGVTYTLKSKDKLCSVTAQKSVWIRNVAATSVTLTASKQTLKVGEEVAATATTKITGNALFWMSASTSFVSVTGVTPYIAIVKGLRPATGANITFSVDDAAKGCRNTAFLPFTVTAAASLVDNESNTTTYTTDLNVYPNPSNGMVTIENIGDAKTISLIDVTGRVLKTTPVNADRMRLDYSTITKGNYFISIQGETIKEMKSIVIE